MLGRDHALLGGVGYLAVAPMLVRHLSPETLGIGAVTSAAFALVPDIDEPGSTVSRKLGPISRSVSRFTNKFAGGHRQGTHSLLFAALVGVGAWYAAQSRLAMTIVVVAGFLLVLRMLLPRSIARMAGVGMLAIDALAGWWMWTRYASLTTNSIDWFLLATAGGCLWHFIGDTLTVEGVPYFWLPGVRPLQSIRVAVPLVGHCGSARESALGVLMSVALVWMVAVLVVFPIAHTVHIPSLHIPSFHLPALPHPSVPNVGGLVQSGRSAAQNAAGALSH
ncbi:MAG: metal-dependent hydrolase [Actinomycetota bacterium]|nr:metal-dependent hydrolase [Actinomycetota bacterium]